VGEQSPAPTRCILESQLPMKRRDFLKLPVAAAALTSIARGAEALAKDRERLIHGFLVRSQQDRHDASLAIMGGRFDLKVSGKDTGGDLCIYDTVRSTKGGPPLHRHYSQDEWFYIIRGEFLVQVGDDRVALAPGDSAFAPRRIPHAFAMTSDGEGQMLVLFQPAGSMEDFFRRMSTSGTGVSAGQQLPKRVWEEHGMELLGPPLKY
jgi:quercetin dioxygenase-like cupin family protein